MTVKMDTAGLALLLMVVSTLLGAGITWGVLRQTTHDQERRLAALEERFDSHRMTCAGTIHEKLNRLCEDVSFLRGRVGIKGSSHEKV